MKIRVRPEDRVEHPDKIRADKLLHRLMETHDGRYQARKDARTAAAMCMAFMISHLGAYETFTPYQKGNWKKLSNILKRNSSKENDERKEELMEQMHKKGRELLTPAALHALSKED